MAEELIARLEMATGPDRELDRDISRACDDPKFCFDIEDWPRRTASIDAALSLMPEGWEWALFCEGGAYRVECGDPQIGLRSEHVTAAGAMCIAALKARAASPKQPGAA